MGRQTHIFAGFRALKLAKNRFLYRVGITSYRAGLQKRLNGL